MVLMGQGKVEDWGVERPLAKIWTEGMCIVLKKYIQYDNIGSYLKNGHRNSIV